VQHTSQLCHPNTVAIYDFGRTPEGIFYYAMEYLDGINLEDLVQKFGPQPAGRVISILRQVCGSLAEAHSIGLVHRDIKPANIILTQRGGIPDFIKLLDFGLVRAVDEQQQARLTTEDALAGTPLYLSPEAINQPDDVDFRTDLYALGAVGYFLVTGTPVFDGRSVIDILNKHTTAAPEPPSQRLGKPVLAELEALLLACLAKKPADRPASAADLAAGLERCVAAKWSPEEAQAWWSQFRPGAVKPSSSAKVRTETLGETIVTSP
jgi:serine/threonine protein kinase